WGNRTVSSSDPILIIEDDDDIRKVAQEALQAAGYVVRSASDGAAALRLLDEWIPKVILLDIRMPGMDGWDFLARYRDRPGPQAPVIVCAATSFYWKRALEAGAVAFLEKPFNLDNLYG